MEKKKKKPLDVAMATPGWPTPYDVWLSGQMRTKGGIKTGVDLGANGAEDSGEGRDGGEGQDGGVPAVTKGVSLQRERLEAVRQYYCCHIYAEDKMTFPRKWRNRNPNTCFLTFRMSHPGSNTRILLI